jgi:hypothetical protein
MNNNLMRLWSKSKIVSDPFTNKVIVTKERSFVGRAKKQGFSRTDIVGFFPNDPTFSYDRLIDAVRDLFPINNNVLVS